jgi:hypothetical protein
MLAGKIRRAFQKLPELVPPLAAVIQVNARAVGEEAHRAELHLPCRPIAPAYRLAVFITGHPFDILLIHMWVAIQAVADLQWRFRGGMEPTEPTEIMLYLPSVAQAGQERQRERCVANPRVPVIVVLIAPDPLRQRAGQGGDGTFAMHVAEQLHC